MATVAELAAQQARKLLEELDPTDEFTSRRRLKRLRGIVLGDLNAYIFRFMLQTQRGAWTPYGLELSRLLLQRPYPEDAIQRFLEQHIPYLEQLVQCGVEQRYAFWRRQLRRLEGV